MRVVWDVATFTKVTNVTTSFEDDRPISMLKIKLVRACLVFCANGPGKFIDPVSAERAESLVVRQAA
jgi:hypothetical protein